MILNIDKMSETQKNTIIKYLNNKDDFGKFTCCSIVRSKKNAVLTFRIDICSNENKTVQIVYLKMITVVPIWF